MYSRIYLEDVYIIKMFINQWIESIHGLERGIVKIEVNSEDGELLNNIVGCVHSIKSGSSFAGLSYITRLSYEIEFSLLEIRSKKLIVDTELIDSLLSAVNFLNKYITKLSESFTENSATDENGLQYYNIENDQEEELILEELKLTREKCQAKVEEGNSLDEEILEEEVGCEILKSQDFNDLSDNGVHDKIKEQIAHFQAISSNKEKVNDGITCQNVVKPEEIKSKASMNQSIRVNEEKIDKMMNMISELLIAKNSFMHISSKLNKEYNLPEMSKEVQQVGAYVNRISDELHNAIMSIRMVQVKTVFQKMPRVVRDIAQSTGKKMELYMEGDSTEIDKTIIEQISDPLVHLIRNAADHGIEKTDDRLLKGKPEIGKIILRAYNKNKHVYIEIEDDGKGINAEKMKEKAIEKGFITNIDAEKMSRNQLLNLIFLPGFSTANQITEVSGRGVGMDIVRSNMAKINGNVTIESEEEKGTKMIIRLPLTLAVSRGLIVEVAQETYIFPLEYIAETVKIQKSNIHIYNGRYFTYLRGEVIGAEWLCKIFLSSEIDFEIDELNAVIITNGAEKYAIIVDKLKSEQEFVVKTLEGHLAAIPGISGSTLLGNGKVVLIVNPPDLLKLIREQ
jgi:two-component system chemotaxis sensor kinase CheA